MINLEYEDLSMKVYNILKTMIYNREFVGGEKLDLSQFSKSMNISITPIKHAVSKLENDGLVEVKPRKGTYVTELTTKDISNMMDMRMMMEQWVIKHLTKQEAFETASELEEIVVKSKKIFSLDEFDFGSFMDFDIDFHNLIIEKHKNENMNRVYSSMNIQFQISRVYYFKKYDRPAKSQEEHEKIVSALKNYEIDKVIDLIKAHLEISEKKMVSVLKENGGVI